MRYFFTIKKTILIFLFILFPLFILTTTREIYLTNKLYLLSFGAILLLLSSTLHLLSSKKISLKQNPLDLPIILFALTVAISIVISSPNKIQAILNPNFGLVSIMSLTIIYFYISRYFVIAISSSNHVIASDPAQRGERGNLVKSKYDTGLLRRGVYPEQSRRAPRNDILTVFLFSSLLLSIVTIVLFFQPLRTLSLPQNLEFLKSPSFTPLGSPLDLAIFLGFFTILGLTRILKRINADHENTKYLPAGRHGFILDTLYFILPLTALTLTVYNILKPALPAEALAKAGSNGFQLILTPFRYSWFAAIETLKNPLTALFGVGVDNFQSIFTKVKDINYNLSSYWNINSFSTSRSTILHIFTETGLFGLVAFSLIMLTLFNTIFTDKKRINTDDKYILPSIVYLLIILLFFLPSLPIFFLFYVTLSVIASASPEPVGTGQSEAIQSNLKRNQIVYNDNTKTFLLSNLAVYIIFVSSLFLLGISSYLLTRSYSAEYYFKKSLGGYQTNNLKIIYDNQKKAISLNPYIERFRLAFSQTNLLLSNNFAVKADKMTDQDRQSLIQAVKTAIDEAKAVTTLNPQKASNWDNLANIYRNIIGLVQGADVWTVSAYQRAIALDPQNPNYRLNLGGIYYAYGKYDDANRFFEQTVDLKPNLANAYYNLAWSSYKKGDYKKAVNSMQNALTLVNPNTAKTDYERAKSELEEFKKMLPESEETSTAGAEVNQSELNLPSLAPTQPQSIIEITP